RRWRGSWTGRTGLPALPACSVRVLATLLLLNRLGLRFGFGRGLRLGFGRCGGVRVLGERGRPGLLAAALGPASGLLGLGLGRNFTHDLDAREGVPALHVLIHGAGDRHGSARLADPLA